MSERTRYELRPCPLCGGEAEWVTTQGVRPPWSMVCLDALGTSVQCRECGCTVPSGMDLGEVRDRWNRRPGDAACLCDMCANDCDERRVIRVGQSAYAACERWRDAE